MASARRWTGAEGGCVLAGNDELGCVLWVSLGAQEAARGGKVMGRIYICDLCKKPLADKPNHTYCFKKWSEECWMELDVHDECMEKFLDAVAKEGDE